MKIKLLRYYTIYMKSGNQIRFRAETVQIKYIGNSLTNLKIVGMPYQHPIVESLCLEQIEGIFGGRNSFRPRIYWG